MASRSNQSTSTKKSASKTNSRKTASGKASSPRGTRTTNSKAKTSTKNTQNENQSLSPEKVREIYLFAYLAVAIFLLCSNFGMCGVIGRGVSGFLFGLFGSITYIIPVYIFLSAAFLISNGPKKKVVKKIVWVGIAIMATGFIFQIAAGAKDMDISKLYHLGFDDRKGGGVLFGGILVALYKMIGQVGAIILTTLLCVIVIIEVTEISIIDMVKKAFTFNLGQEEDNYFEDDDYEKRPKPPVVPVRDNGRDMLSQIEVLQAEEDEKADAKSKSTKKNRKKKNSKVQDEEVYELTSLDDSDDFYMFDDVDGANKNVNIESKDREVTPESAKASIDSLFESAKQDIKQVQVPNLNKKHKTISNEFVDLKPIKDSYMNGESEVSFDTAEPDKESASDDNYEDIQQYERDFFELSGENSADELFMDDPVTDFTATDIEKESNQNKKIEIKNTDRVEAYSDISTDVKAEVKQDTVKKGDKEAATASVMNEINKQTSEKPKVKTYKFPPVNLLKSGRGKQDKSNDSHVKETAIKLKQTLDSFGVNVTITNYSCGPAVTRYEMQPEVGVKVSKIVNLADDIKLNLAASDIRIEAPIPGKAAIGIEVPNKENQMVYFRDLIDNDNFKKFPSNIAFAVGKDISGQVIVTDIAKMPHLLIAGSTGSGKSVCINTLIMSILYKANPDDVKLIMVDPKMVELTAYNGIPHLLIPVVTDPKKASGALNWAVMEMTNRYQLFAKYNVRNLQGFNKKVEEVSEMEGVNEDDLKKMPQIVVIVDELADLMMVAHGEVEDSIVRLSQLARAAGIHLVIATQRPSVDVITGLIKANVPSRIAFAVSSGVDSRTILDMNGAEKLLGKGDMLFYPTGYTKPVRVQGAFISDEEVTDIVEFIKKQYGESTYDEAINKSIESSAGGQSAQNGNSPGNDSSYDEYFEEAARLVIEKDKASIGNLQRVFRIGFNRAARIMDQLYDAGVVGPEEGTKPRKILMTMEQLEDYMSL